jgi:hypothetical protein
VAEKEEDEEIETEENVLCFVPLLLCCTYSLLLLCSSASLLLSSSDLLLSPLPSLRLSGLSHHHNIVQVSQLGDEPHRPNGPPVSESPSTRTSGQSDDEEGQQSVEEGLTTYFKVHVSPLSLRL